MSDSTNADAPRKRVVERFKRLIVKKLFHRGFVSGTRARQYLMDLGMAESRIHLGYDAVDNDYFGAGAAVVRMSSSAPMFDLPQRYFLCVARLAAEKNIDLLLRSFFAYRAMGGTWSLLLIGKGDLEHRLKTTVLQSEYAAFVNFIGYRSYAEIIPYYAFAGALVLPSKSEPWGLVINEAMAAGVPVIASSACGACGDLVIHTKTGFIFDPGSEKELCEAMLKMSQMAPDESRQIASRARERVAEYSVEAFSHSVLASVRGTLS